MTTHRTFKQYKLGVRYYFILVTISLESLYYVSGSEKRDISVANIESVDHDAIDRILWLKEGKHRVRDRGKFSNTSRLLFRYEVHFFVCFPDVKVRSEDDAIEKR